MIATYFNASTGVNLYASYVNSITSMFRIKCVVSFLRSMFLVGFDTTKFSVSILVYFLVISIK